MSAPGQEEIDLVTRREMVLCVSLAAMITAGVCLFVSRYDMQTVNRRFDEIESRLMLIGGDGQYIKQEVNIAAKATNDQLAAEVTKRIEDAKYAMSHTSRP